ncbi:hypothetical protein MNB_ARC-1_34 [hydrothermal vent metagenome]|uniref:Uncharacterized protein n=1 Tax=hydrothermal vent metagenome TaxID=652676 RepID=A0A3B1E6W5_9ZZZZ
MIKDFVKVFLIVDFVVIFFCLYQYRFDWILNLQFAFVSSLLIIIGSYLGYKQNIEKRASNYLVDTNEPDSIDMIDDKFDLYRDELKEEKIKKIFLDEKKKSKSIAGASSVYRLIGYGILIIGFFYLNNNGLLDPIPYLLGFLITPIAILCTKFTIN